MRRIKMVLMDPEGQGHKRQILCEGQTKEVHGADSLEVYNDYLIGAAIGWQDSQAES